MSDEQRPGRRARRSRFHRNPRRPPAAADVLIVMAHPDDAEFVCGGTIAKLCAEGRRVTYVLATSGDKGTAERDIEPWALAARREAEQRNAAATLGAQSCAFLGYPDGFLEDTADLRGKLVRLIRTLRPDLLITWDGFRRSFNHRDHRAIGVAALDATFPLARDHLAYPEHLTGEGLEPHKVGEVWLAGTDDPNYYVDTGDYFHQRMLAAACHVSQFGGRPPEALEERMRERAKDVGAAVGMDYAESFRRLTFRR